MFFLVFLRFGIRFPCMSDAYSKDLRKLVLDITAELGYSNFVREGVYCMVSGPNFETIAEARMLHILGSDSVGMDNHNTQGARMAKMHMKNYRSHRAAAGKVCKPSCQKLDIKP